MIKIVSAPSINRELNRIIACSNTLCNYYSAGVALVATIKYATMYCQEKLKETVILQK